MSSASGSSSQSSDRATAMILVAVGFVICVAGVAFIATNQGLRATTSFIVGVLALAGGGFMLVRKPR